MVLHFLETGSTYSPGFFPTWVPGMVPTPAAGMTYAPNIVPTPAPGMTYSPGFFPTWVPGMVPMGKTPYNPTLLILIESFSLFVRKYINTYK